MEGNNQNLEQTVVLSNRKIFIALMATLTTILLGVILLSNSRSDFGKDSPRYEFHDATDKASELFREAGPAAEPEESASDPAADLSALPMLSYRLENFSLPGAGTAEEPAEEPAPPAEPPGPTEEELLQQRLLQQALTSPASLELDFSESGAGTQHSFADPQATASSSESVRAGSNGTLSSYSQFENNDYINDHQVEQVRSPFVLLQGSLIPAVLLTGINSQLPGQISAQVTTDIYDSLTGEELLIPSGSRLIGQYASAVQMGMERVFSGFSRLILPDGRSLNLGSMPGQSLDGYSGLDAEVDNHYLRLLVDSFLLAGFATAEGIVSRDVYDDQGKPRPTALMAQQFETQIGQASTRILERHINLSPTLSVKPGTIFNIAVIKDLYFQGNYED